MESLVSFGFLALPTVFISLCLIGGVIAAAGWRSGVVLALVSSLCLYAAATPALSSLLLRRVEAGLPRRADLARAQAIVVLGGDMRLGNGADIPDRLGRLSIERLVFAADAYRTLHLPVLVSGGPMESSPLSEAAMMKAMLESEFAVPVKWTEGRSLSTWQNAAYSARILRAAGLSTVVVVTQAWHLPRALWCFERQGIAALPWPAPRTAARLDDPSDYLPNPDSLTDTFDGLHELIGGLYYRLRY